VAGQERLDAAVRRALVHDEDGARTGSVPEERIHAREQARGALVVDDADSETLGRHARIVQPAAAPATGYFAGFRSTVTCFTLPLKKYGGV
jgi:hypothetical protein